MTVFEIALVLLLPYVVVITLAMLVRGHYRRIECIACRNRRRVVRVVLLLSIVALVLTESQIHPPDFGFLALAIAMEVTA